MGFGKTNISEVFKKVILISKPILGRKQFQRATNEQTIRTRGGILSLFERAKKT